MILRRDVLAMLIGVAPIARAALSNKSPSWKEFTSDLTDSGKITFSIVNPVSPQPPLTLGRRRTFEVLVPLDDEFGSCNLDSLTIDGRVFRKLQGPVNMRQVDANCFLKIIGSMSEENELAISAPNDPLSLRLDLNIESLTLCRKDGSDITALEEVFGED